MTIAKRMVLMIVPIFVACINDSETSTNDIFEGFSSSSTCIELEETFDVSSGKFFVCYNGRWEQKNVAKENSSETIESSSSDEMIGFSSSGGSSSFIENSSETIESSSSDEIIESSSNEEMSSSGFSFLTEVMPLGFYDCEEYDCVTQEFLNGKMLSSREYGEILDLRDNKVYNVVTIGRQVWMAQNLEYDYNVGTALSFCHSSYNYGYLYMWSAAMDSAAIFSNDGAGCGNGTNCKSSGMVRGVCPRGWHLPTKNDFEELINYIERSFGVGDDEVAPYLKSIVFNDSERYDTFGFSVTHSGKYNFSGTNYLGSKFDEEGYRAYFWSSNEYTSTKTIRLQFDTGNFVSLPGDDKRDGVSVRCLMDN